MKPKIVIETAFGTLPLVASPEQMSKVYGRSGRALRVDCESGIIPTLPRAPGSGSWHRIPVTKALDDLGIPYQIVSLADLPVQTDGDNA